ncbi:uncharacterized protein BDCG_09486 [Blastomyces dermatitidis ER-3]|uniref:Uncharacterized protein n=1 Tax=Ajellomyces dermatitidis (strain ER-3 / ATCC MYA-2586) TaxID=559297 RepID=A0ABP2ERC5_AJEDR|nr:uncharacterized protein BDCG_09486 [Blastomyces dermatitidis ER-3]EEQ86217.1 hypothetical protein BDCG_09486 [Blastomyces dermatitidis ER-3]
MPRDTTPKTQPWKALSSLAEDKNPDLMKRNLNSQDNCCSMGTSVSKPNGRKIEYKGWAEDDSAKHTAN